MSRQDVASHAAAFWAAVLFGVSVVATRIVAQQMPPISLAVLRFGLGSLILLLCLVVVAPGYLYVARRDLALFLLLGAVPFGAFPVLFDAGLRLTTASRGALMLATMPLWTAVLAWLAREERPDARQEPARTMLGDGMMLAAALCGAVYSALAPRALARYTATTVTAYTMAAGVLLLLPGACTERGWKAAAGLDATGIVLVLFLGLLGGALGYLCLTYSLTHLAPTQATIYVNENPVVAAALAGLLLDEQLTIAFGAGLIAVIGGVLLVNVSARRPRERRVAPPAVAPPARV
jgi:drug/metabolite transporter (DMT)-like permease